MSNPSKEITWGRRPGEAVGTYLLSSVLGAMLRNRHAGYAQSVGTLLHGPDTITVRSTSFKPDGPIPDRFAGAGRGGNVSPQLEWSGIPEGTRQLLLVMEDPDVPLKRPVVHMAGLFDPSITGFSEGELTRDATDVRWIPSFRRTGYHGPRALPRHGVHHYHFFLFALDEAIPAEAELPNIDAVIARAKDHVLARGRVTGTQLG